MEGKNEVEETFNEISNEELKKVFEKNKKIIDLKNENNIFLTCKISKQEALNGCNKKIKFKQICENGKKEQNTLDIKIPKGIQNNQSIVYYNQGNYIKEYDKMSNIIIKIDIY